MHMTGMERIVYQSKILPTRDCIFSLCSTYSCTLRETVECDLGLGACASALGWSWVMYHVLFSATHLWLPSSKMWILHHILQNKAAEVMNEIAWFLSKQNICISVV